jgi:alkanesulfonate monooxygenase SsuD/methylene tetrahydromethanopterin reductase-like flavin-dependent oxidoreductase (luciferase family)
MEVWSFCENDYPGVFGTSDSLRNNLPNRLCDPKVAADLLNRHLDEWQMCDELGINICINEHHSTATSLNASCVLPLAIMARETKRVRLMSLGIHIANQPNPVRVAEEIALIDLYSRGRFEMGLVRGAPYEIYPANAQPVAQMRRFMEAYDLIYKALTATDGPFNWEGEYYHFRNVNIWPRPYQQPAPPTWFVSLSPTNGGWIAEKNAKIATFLSGRGSKPLFDSYRKRCEELGRPAKPEHLAYMAIISVAETEELAKARARKIAQYLNISRHVAAKYGNPPGYLAVKDSAKSLGQKASFSGIVLGDGRRVAPETASVEELIDAYAVFAGTPDVVFKQIKAYDAYAGGVGNLIMMGQFGDLSHAETVDNYRLFSKEVLPRLKDLKHSAPEPCRVMAQAR